MCTALPWCPREPRFHGGLVRTPRDPRFAATPSLGGWSSGSLLHKSRSPRGKNLTIIAQEIEKDVRQISLSFVNKSNGHNTNADWSAEFYAWEPLLYTKYFLISKSINGFCGWILKVLTSSGSDLLMRACGSKLFSRSTWMPVRILTWCRRLLTFSKERSSYKRYTDIFLINCY